MTRPVCGGAFLTPSLALGGQRLGPVLPAGLRDKPTGGFHVKGPTLTPTGKRRGGRRVRAAWMGPLFWGPETSRQPRTACGSGAPLWSHFSSWSWSPRVPPPLRSGWKRPLGSLHAPTRGPRREASGDRAGRWPPPPPSSQPRSPPNEEKSPASFG